MASLALLIVLRSPVSTLTAPLTVYPAPSAETTAAVTPSGLPWAPGVPGSRNREGVSKRGFPRNQPLHSGFKSTYADSVKGWLPGQSLGLHISWDSPRRRTPGPPGAQVPTLGMVLGGSPGGSQAGAGPTSRHAGFRCPWALLHMFTGHPGFISGAKLQCFPALLCPLSCPYWLVGARMHCVL